MTLLIDPPAWGAHGRLWSHLISDTSLAELHDFAGRSASRVGRSRATITTSPRSGMPRCCARGPLPSPGDLLAALSRFWTEVPETQGDKGIERLIGLTLPSGTVADVDLVASPREMDERRVFAAMVFLSDAGGDLVAVHSVRRDQWVRPAAGAKRGVSAGERDSRSERGDGSPSRLTSCRLAAMSGGATSPGRGPTGPGRTCSRRSGRPWRPSVRSDPVAR